MLQTATKTTSLVSLATFKEWLNVTSGKTKAISSLTSVGTVATAVCTGHGYATGAFVVVAGAVQSAYNGSFLITMVDANTFTFTLPSSATSPATGTPTVTPDDGRYASFVDAATAELENQIDVPFVTRTIVETFSGDAKCEHALANNPVASISSFTMNGSAATGAYVLNSDTGVITFTDGTVFAWGIKNIVVTYTAGYDVQDGAALPSDIVRACLDLAKAMHDELVSNAIAATSVSLGPASMVIKPAKMPPSVQRVFDAWAGVGMRA
jgi:hypothetical protein